MNENEILSRIRSECESTAPDNFHGLKRKIELRHSKILCLKIAAAVAAIALPVTSVLISDHFNTIRPGNINIAEVSQNQDTAAQITQINSSTTSSTYNSVSGIINSVQNSTSETQRSFPVTSPPFSTACTMPGKPAVTAQAVHNNSQITSVPSSDNTQGKQTEVEQTPNETIPAQNTDPPANRPAEDNDTSDITAIVPETSVGSDLTSDTLKRIEVIKNEMQPSDQEYLTEIYKGTEYYYTVINPENYIVILEYSDRTEEVTVSQALMDSSVSIEKLITAGLNAVISGTVK